MPQVRAARSGQRRTRDFALPGLQRNLRSGFAMNDDVTLPLNANEALVLFEFLTRFVDHDRLEIVDQAEQRVLWNIQAQLETMMDCLNNPRYEEEVTEARRALRDPQE